MITSVRSLPPHPSLEQYRKQAKDLVKAWRSDNAEAWERLRKFHPRAGNSSEKAAPTLADAQLVVAREHGFESWPRFARHVEALNRVDSLVPAFELAADAVVSGDVARLENLLRRNPALIRERSTRTHRGTLLHYVGANGVEDFRQKSPKNAVDILKLLLKAGAEVDAAANMYDADRTLGLVATSIHPLRAGIQRELIETLLAAGAAVDPGQGIVNACLSNGRGEAAEFLAQRGARLDLEGACGVGRLGLVRTYFNDDGTLKGGATAKQAERGLNWACEYGRSDVVGFLLGRGLDPGVSDDHGQTALHWAVIGGQLQVTRTLLARHAPLEAVNVYGGTVLGQAVWSALHDSQGNDYVPIIAALLAAGADRSAVALPTGSQSIDHLLVGES